jgi:hypothetical protein
MFGGRVIYLCAESLCTSEATHSLTLPTGGTVRLCDNHRIVLLAAARLAGIDPADVAALIITPLRGAPS